MSDIEIRRLAIFLAKDENGTLYEIHQYREYLHSRTREGTIEFPGPVHLQLSDGRRVNRCEKGKYLIVANGIVLTTDDPDAY